MINQQPYIWYQLLDDSGTRGTQRYHVRRGTSPSVGQQAATTMRGLLSAFSGCAFLEQRFVLPAVEISAPAPAAGIQTERHAVFVFSTNIENQYAILAVPGLRNELLQTNGPGAGVNLDISHPDVSAFVAEMVSGRWCNRFGYTLVALEAAYMQVRNAVYVPDWMV